MLDVTTSSQGILILLENLNPNKAAGPDRLKPLVLQKLLEPIVPVLEVILVYPVPDFTANLPGFTGLDFC